MMKLLGDELLEVIKAGKEGLNEGYKSGIETFPNLRQGSLVLLLGGTGTGKSFNAIMQYGIDPFLDWYENYRNLGRLYRWNIFSFEMERSEVLVRLAAYMYAKANNKLLPSSVIEGLVTDKLTAEDELWLTENAVPLLNEFTPYIKIFGKKNPKQIRNIVEAFYHQHGKLEKNEEGEVIFTTDEHIMCVNTIDHVALLKGDSSSKKAKIDEMAEEGVDMKTIYKATFVFVQQLNRAEGDIQKIKLQPNPKPSITEAKDTGDIGDAADMIIATFNPYRFEIERYLGYPITGPQGLGDRARFLFILKNRKGKIGHKSTAFYGESGLFQILPEAVDLTARDIKSIREGTWFKKEKK
jgi:hypothetical protein